MEGYDANDKLHEALRRIVCRRLAALASGDDERIARDGMLTNSVAQSIANPRISSPFKRAEDVCVAVVRALFPAKEFVYEDLSPNQKGVDFLSKDETISGQVKLGWEQKTVGMNAIFSFYDAAKTLSRAAIDSGEKITYVFFARSYHKKVNVSFSRNATEDFLLFRIVTGKDDGFVTVIPHDEHTANIVHKLYIVSPTGNEELRKTLDFYENKRPMSVEDSDKAPQKYQKTETPKMVAYTNCARLAGPDLTATFKSADVLPSNLYPQNRGSTAQSLRKAGHTEFTDNTKKFTRLTDEGRRFIRERFGSLVTP